MKQINRHEADELVLAHGIAHHRFHQDKKTLRFELILENGLTLIVHYDPVAREKSYFTWAAEKQQSRLNGKESTKRKPFLRETAKASYPTNYRPLLNKVG